MTCQAAPSRLGIHAARHRGCAIDAPVYGRAVPLRPVTRRGWAGRRRVLSGWAGSVTAGSYHLLLPNVKININPGCQNLSIGPIYPDGVDKTVGFLDYYFGADADEAWIDSMMAFDSDVGNEDGALVAAAQLGVAGSWIDRGRILPQERLLASFQRYVHSACADEVPAGLG